MRIFAEVRNGIVTNVFEWQDYKHSPVLSADAYFIDVTAFREKPSVGDKHEKYQGFYRELYPDLSIQELKELKINTLKENGYTTITEEYPVWKQINYLRDKDIFPEKYNEMVDFIDDIRKRTNNLEIQILEQNTKEDIESINIGL